MRDGGQILVRKFGPYSRIKIEDAGPSSSSSIEDYEKVGKVAWTATYIRMHVSSYNEVVSGEGPSLKVAMGKMRLNLRQHRDPKFKAVHQRVKPETDKIDFLGAAVREMEKRTSNKIDDLILGAMFPK